MKKKKTRKQKIFKWKFHIMRVWSMAKTNTIKKGIQLLLYNEHGKDFPNKLSSSINNYIYVSRISLHLF